MKSALINDIFLVSIEPTCTLHNFYIVFFDNANSRWIKAKTAL